MPTYEYACTSCGHRLEAVQSFSDDPLTECPECGRELRKVYAPVGIVLKGSGFYKTDSRAAAGAATEGARRRRTRPRARRRARETTKDTASTPGDGKDAKPAATAAT